MRMDAFHIDESMKVVYYDKYGDEDYSYKDDSEEDVSLANITKNTIFTIADKAVSIGTKVADNSSVVETNVMTKYTGGVVNFGVCALVILIFVIILLFLNIGSVRTFVAGICTNKSHMIKQIVLSVLSVILLIAVYILINRSYSGLEDSVSEFCSSAIKKYDGICGIKLSNDISVKFGFIMMIILQVVYVIGAVLQSILLGIAKNEPQTDNGQGYGYYNNAGNMGMNTGMNYGNNGTNMGTNYGYNGANTGMNYGNNGMNMGTNYGYNETAENADTYAQQQYVEQTAAATGEEVQKICPNCGMANNPENKFCKKCGSPLG